MPHHPIFDRRLLFVSGKGGVGKTITTAAIALWAFRRRKRVLVVELSPYGRLRELLGGPEPGPQPVEIQPHLEIVRIEPREALEDFLEGVLPFRALRQRLLQSSSFSILTAAAPGIEEFLVLARIVGFEALRTGLRRRPRYDLIVVDAPATGHSLPLLSTARTLMEMMPLGPIGKMAQDVGAVLADPQRSATVIVTIPEEMAVNETIEITSEIHRSGAIALGPIVVNAVWPERFTAEEARWLLSSTDGSDPLIAAGRYHVEKRRRADEHIARLRSELRVEPVILPFFSQPGDDRPSLRKLVAAFDAALPGDLHVVA
ncbi:MAG: ArsA family ATPase [Candidatus Binatia bacterium]